MTDIRVKIDNKAVEQATSHESIRALLHQAIEEQGVPMATGASDPSTVQAVNTARFSREQFDRDDRGRFVSPNQPQAADEPKTVSRAVTIGDREYEFTAPTADELERQVENAKFVHETLTKDATERARTVDPARQAADRAELELQFKQGQISAEEYIERTGAVERVLAKQGVRLEDLQGISEQKYTQAWSDAADQFRANHPEWPGGQANMKTVGLTLQALNLTEADDKLAALEAAYAEMKRQNLLLAAEPPTITDQKALEMANDMSPAEIIDTYRESLAAQGQNAGDAFVSSYRDPRQKGQTPSKTTPAQSSGMFGR